MASSNVKYTPAPQVDPELYPQAPPSYQAESSTAAAAARDAQGLFAGGIPRDSEDNLPDDFKFGGSVAEATIDIRNQFVRKVYGILTVQLIATAAVSAVSFFNESYKVWIQTHPGLVYVSVSIYSLAFDGAFACLLWDQPTDPGLPSFTWL